MTLGSTVGCDAIGALPLAEELAGMGINALPDSFELIGHHLTREAEQLSPPSVPLADDALALGIIITVLQVPG